MRTIGASQLPLDSPAILLGPTKMNQSNKYTSFTGDKNGNNPHPLLYKRCPIFDIVSEEGVCRMSCPVHHSSDTLNSANMMESDLAQESSHSEMSKIRVYSSIPRSQPTETDSIESSSTWLYPSEQMFYNAMKRKGSEPRPEDMQLVVNIHNIVNEQCWMEILKWESMHNQYMAPDDPFSSHALLLFIGVVQCPSCIDS